MKVTWLGQAGLLLEKGETKIIVDPYLSDSVKEINPNNYRRVKVDESFFDVRPDVLILTHNHLDHTDPLTLEKYLKRYDNITVLASKNAWECARKFGGNHNYVMFNKKTTWTKGELKFKAVYAEHSDDYSIGVIIDDGERKYYITGDTLYNDKIFDEIPSDIYALFLPVNGVGNNMNFDDAKEFSKRINPKKTVPLHFGMFDEIDISLFECQNKVEPKIYEEIEI